MAAFKTQSEPIGGSRKNVRFCGGGIMGVTMLTTPDRRVVRTVSLDFKMFQLTSDSPSVDTP